jgi:hypothetical protein
MTYQRAVLPILILVVCPTLLLFRYAPGERPLPNTEKKQSARSIHLADEVTLFAISPDDRTFAAIVTKPSKQIVVRLHDLATGAALSQDDLIGEYPRCLKFSPDGSKLAVMDWVRSRPSNEPPFRIQLWNLNAERKLTPSKVLEPSVEHYGIFVFHLAFSPDGNTLAAGTRDEVIYLWDTTTGKIELQFQGGVTAGFSADGKTVFGVSHDGFIRRFDATTGRHLGPTEPVRRLDYVHVSQVAFSPDSRLVVLGDEHSVLVKDVYTNQTICRVDLPWGGRPLGFTADGKTLAVDGQRGIHFVDVISGRERTWVKREEGPSFLTGNGRFLVLCKGEVVELSEASELLSLPHRSPPPAKTKPPGVSLEAELTALQDTYTLDLEANSRQDYLTRIHYGEPPDPPRVNLLLTLRNTGREIITLKEPDTKPWLHLIGPGGLNTWEWVSTGVGAGPPGPQPLILAPGKTHSVRVAELGSIAGTSYWLLPGEYSIAGSLHTAVSPAPKGSQVGLDEECGYITVLCAPVKIKVIELAGPPPPPPTGDASPISRPPAPGTAIVPNLSAPRLVDSQYLLKNKLSKPVNLEHGVAAGTPLADIVAFLNDRYDLEIRFDSAAFKAVGKDKVAETKMGLEPHTQTAVSVVLHLLLERIDAGLELRKDGIWIVPLEKPKSLVERLDLADWTYRRHHLSKSINVENGIPKGTTLEKALEVIGELSGLTIVLDVRAFERAAVKDIAQKPVQLDDAGELPVNIVLDKLLRQVNAGFSARERAVIVFPRK